jgi:hypothetical protein
MTEAEWVKVIVPRSMLEWIHRRATDRKMRLFACACARRIWAAVEECRGSAIFSEVTLAEAFADGKATLRKMATARENRCGVGEYSPFADALNAGSATIEMEALKAALGASTHSIMGFALLAREEVPESGEEQRRAVIAAQQTESCTQAAVIRDIFGNPFHPVPFDPVWRTVTVVALARQMYESRDFGAMPILADALQDAGCDSADILDHCRGLGPHVRGCWVLDLVLGKE